MQMYEKPTMHITQPVSFICKMAVKTWQAHFRINVMKILSLVFFMHCTVCGQNTVCSVKIPTDFNVVWRLFKILISKLCTNKKAGILLIIASVWYLKIGTPVLSCRVIRLSPSGGCVGGGWGGGGGVLNPQLGTDSQTKDWRKNPKQCVLSFCFNNPFGCVL